MSNSIKKIEEIISQLENYVRGCKPRAFSNSEIIVNREDIEGYLQELRRKTPEEIKSYQKIIAQKEAILTDAANRAKAMTADAEREAHALLEQATQEHNQMISEHEIYLRAQARADEQVNMAMAQAQEIVDRATMEANSYKDAANRYMEEVLGHLSKIIAAASQSAMANYTKTQQNTEDSFRKLMDSLGEYQSIIQDNMKQLHPNEEVPAPSAQEEQEDGTSSEEE